MKIAILLFFICLTSFLSAQNQKETFEYIGVIKLNDSAFISYKLAFEEHLGIIQGYSITNAGGKHETKSNIRGKYDKEEKKIMFKEYNIVYTKSPLNELDMCLVNFETNMRNLEKNKAFSGSFKGLYQDGKPCLDGDIILSNVENALARGEKLERKIQKSKRVSDNVKQRFKAKRLLDTVTMSVVKKDENLNVFARTKDVIVSIYDSGKVDNDRINLYVDDELILEDYAIEKDKREIPIKITKDFTVIRVVALNEGTSAPNTVKVEILDGMDLITTRTSLKEGESAALTLVKE